MVAAVIAVVAPPPPVTACGPYSSVPQPTLTQSDFGTFQP